MTNTTENVQAQVIFQKNMHDTEVFWSELYRLDQAYFSRAINSEEYLHEWHEIMARYNRGEE